MRPSKKTNRVFPSPPLDGVTSLRYNLTWFLNFQFFPRQHLSENLISAKLPILGMQFKTIDFLSNTLHSISPQSPVSLSP